MKKNTWLVPWYGNKLKKMWLMMRFTICMFLIGILTANAGVYSQNEKVNLSMKNVALKNVIWEIEKQTGFVFMYSTDDLSKTSKLDVLAVDKTVKDVLKTCLDGTNLAFIIHENVIIIKPAPKVSTKEVEQKNVVVKGVVRDSKGNSLPGVSVVVKGTQTGVATDIDGKFEIKVDDKPGVVLVFSFVGMKAKEVKVGNKKELKVILESDSETLEEVICTGYQTISKERATGSFSIINTKKLDSKINSDLKSSLEGQVPGLVLDKDGKIEIRGVSTFKAQNNPLIILDGYPFEGEFEDIDVENIASVNILKDAVAASIYGAKSSNGVIVIETKTGRKNETSIRYKGTYGIQLKPDLDYLNRASASDYIDIELEEAEDYGWLIDDYNDPAYTMSPVYNLVAEKKLGIISEQEFNSKISSLAKNDVLKEADKYIFRPKKMQTHNLIISHGSNNNILDINVNYRTTKENMIHNDNDRISLSLKDRLDITDKLRVDLKTNFSINNSNNSSTSYSTFTDLIYTGIYPYTKMVDPETGEHLSVPTRNNPVLENFASDPDLKNLDYYPIKDLEYGIIKNTTINTRVGADVSYEPIENLVVKVGGCYSRGFTHSRQHIEEESYNARSLFVNGTDAGNHGIHHVPAGGMLRESRNVFNDFTLKGQINYKTKIGENDNLIILVGGEKRQVCYDRCDNGLKFGYDEFSGSFVDVNNYDLKNKRYSGIKSIWFDDADFGHNDYRDNRYVSYFNNASYEINNKYIFSYSVRFDQSNLFGASAKNNLTPLWSVGFNYKISDEDFFQSNIINSLKLRTSYGVNGNIAKDNGPFLLLGTSYWNNDFIGRKGTEIVSVRNDGLKWEKTTSYNLGFDVALLDNKINFTLDLYSKQGENLLANDGLDYTYGKSSILRNLGEIENKGYELSLRTKNITADNFSWKTNLMVSYNKSLAKRIYNSLTYVTDYMYAYNYVEGYPLNSVFALKFAGLNHDTGHADVYDKDGNIIGSGDAEVGDQIYMGTCRPKYVISITNTFEYKNFELSAMLVCKAGHKIRKDCFKGSNYNHADVAKRWREPGDEEHTNVPVYNSWSDDIWYYPFMDINVIDGAYCKLRDLTLTYNFPESFLKKFKVEKAKLYFQGRNLFLIAANKAGIDPEFYEHSMSTSTSSFTSQSSRTLPKMEEFYIGLSIDF